MANDQLSVTTRLKRNEDGMLYLLVGALTAFLSWVLIPIAGLVSVYCGSKLYRERTIAGVAIAVVGFTGVALWLNWLVTSGV